jgi:hypothetical protein
MGEEMWNCRRVSTCNRSESRSGGRGRTIARQLVGTSEKQRHIPALASDSPIAGRFGVPAGGRENYLRSSADVARPRFIGRTIFQGETCSLERSAYACGQAQVACHSISRLGAEGSPASRTESDRGRGCFTIGARPVTFELNMKMPPDDAMQTRRSCSLPRAGSPAAAGSGR